SELLVDAHCPVLLTTSAMEPINRITFAYDGSYSSMYAIKMFTYLFPEWNDKLIDLIYITAKQTTDLPGEKQIESWLASHYKKVEIQIIKGDVQRTLIDYLKSRAENNFLVMGAFGRSAVSRIFHKSLSQAVIDYTTASVFITHK
ncbi:MAG TPA: universal stress protein, partial [Niastella sp.]|nr:universal stress protein [Niastella sp.]